MSTPFRLLGQGISEVAQDAARWRDCFFALSDKDIENFTRFRSARFLVRERSVDEFDHDDHLAPNRPGARALVTVYRSGHRDPFWEMPGWSALRLYISKAEWALEKCPALSADAVVDHSPRTFGPVSPMVSGFIYVDAPGSIVYMVENVVILKNCDLRNTHPYWLRIMAERQKHIDIQRGFERRRLSHYQGPSLFTLDHLKR